MFNLLPLFTLSSLLCSLHIRTTPPISYFPRFTSPHTTSLIVVTSENAIPHTTQEPRFGRLLRETLLTGSGGGVHGSTFLVVETGKFLGRSTA